MDSVYCSKNISQNLDKLKDLSGTNNLLIREIYGRYETVTDEIFSKYLINNNIYCLDLDSYKRYDTDGNEIGNFLFLEPNILYQEEWTIFKKSSLKSIIYFLYQFSIVFGLNLISFMFVVLLYYKIILYIIFGKSKDVLITKSLK